MPTKEQKLKYTSDLIDEIMSANPNWWTGVFDMKVASKWKERNKKKELSYKTKCDILLKLGYEIKVNRTEDLWELSKPKRFSIKNSAEDFGIIEAPNKDKAIADIVKQKFPRKKTIDIAGVKYDMADIFKTALIVEEVF